MVGETIGNFKVISRLGVGGMGEVWLAEQQNIGTRVAIKLLNASVSQDSEHVQRFFNEARAVSRIQHAGIVKIFDVGHHAGQAYLIMEYLDGETLAQRLRRTGRLPLAQISDIGRQIASVLDATHSAGITHRDLKPDNVFLVPDRELGERVKILDFGIAKLTGTLAGVSPRTIGTMGTPAYMAPEQWGDASKVDWRADLYSLGCVAFEMTCGRPPFIVTNIAEACGKHLNEAPPAASSLVPTVPAELEQLLRTLLAKDPAARPASMREVARAFELVDKQALGVAATLAIGAVALAAPTQAPAPRSSPVAAIMLGVLVLGAGAAGTIYYLQRGSSAAHELGPEAAVALVTPDADVVARPDDVQTPRAVPATPDTAAQSEVHGAAQSPVHGAAQSPVDARVPSRSAADAQSPADAGASSRSAADAQSPVDAGARSRSAADAKSPVDAGAPSRSAADAGRTKSPAKPSPSRAGGTASDADADAELIHQAVRARSAQTKRCYEAALREDATLAGTVTLQFKIDGNGRVIEATATGLTEKLQTCLLAQIREIAFPKPRNAPVSIIFPFRFEPE